MLTNIVLTDVSHSGDTSSSSVRLRAGSFQEESGIPNLELI